MVLLIALVQTLQNLQKSGQHLPKSVNALLIYSPWFASLPWVQSLCFIRLQHFASYSNAALLIAFKKKSGQRNLLITPYPTRRLSIAFKKSGRLLYLPSKKAVNAFLIALQHLAYRLQKKSGTLLIYACHVWAQVLLDRPWSTVHGRKEKEKSDFQVEQIFRTRA